MRVSAKLSRLGVGAHREPDRERAVRLADHQRAVADQEGQRRDRRAAGGADRRRGAVAAVELPPVEAARLRCRRRRCAASASISRRVSLGTAAKRKLCSTRSTSPLKAFSVTSSWRTTPACRRRAGRRPPPCRRRTIWAAKVPSGRRSGSSSSTIGAGNSAWIVRGCSAPNSTRQSSGWPITRPSEVAAAIALPPGGTCAATRVGAAAAARRSRRPGWPTAARRRRRGEGLGERAFDDDGAVRQAQHAHACRPERAPRRGSGTRRRASPRSAASTGQRAPDRDPRRAGERDHLEQDEDQDAEDARDDREAAGGHHPARRAIGPEPPRRGARPACGAGGRRSRRRPGRGSVR